MDSFFIYLQINFLTPNTKIYKISKNPEITENDLKFDNTYLDFEYQDNMSMREDLDLLLYDEYDTILPLSWSKLKFSKLLVRSKNQRMFSDINT